MAPLYHTAAEVQAELKNIEVQASGTIISSTQLDGYMAATEAVVTGRVSRKYTMPVNSTDNPAAFAIIKTICIKMSAGRCEQILRRNAVEATADGDKTRLRSLIKDAEDMLDQLDQDLLILTDAARFADIENNVGYEQAPAGVNQGPIIQKGVKQW